MKNLVGKFEELQRNIYSKSYSHLIGSVSREILTRMVSISENDDYLKKSIKNMYIYADNFCQNNNDYQSLMEFKNIYREGCSYLLLKDKPLDLSHIKEKKTSTPDFKVLFNKQNIFIEFKGLNLSGGTYKHKKITDQARESKANVDSKIKSNKSAFDEFEFNPYKSNGDNNDEHSIRINIETLIDKISQNIDVDQFKSGDTLLLVDLDQFPISSQPSDAIKKEYNEWQSDRGKETPLKSGMLWYVAFGKLNDEIFKPERFEGFGNYADGKLKKQGILHSYEYIKGLIFLVNDNFYSLARILLPIKKLVELS